MTYRASRHRHRAFTLAELLVSSAATAVLVTGVASAMLLASQALPENRADLDSLVTAGGVAEQISTELSCALLITERTATAIEFAVGDRDGDSQPELIRYHWSGTVGEPLYRQYNGGEDIAVLEGAADVSFTYTSFTAEEEGDPVENESGEIELDSFYSGGGLDDASVGHDSWPAQYFKPDLSADATKWRVTRIFFGLASRGSDDGECRIQLQRATGQGKPTGDVIAEHYLLEEELDDSFNYYEAVFADAPLMPAAQGLCVVFAHVSDAHSARVVHAYSGSVDTPGFLLRSDDRGSTWDARSDRSMIYFAYGTEIIPGAPEMVTVEYATSVGLLIQLGDSEDYAVETAVQLLNTPEVGS